MVNIKERRIELGMTREEFINAVYPEVKPGTVLNIEIHRTRLRDIDMKALKKIAKVLRCKVKDLLPKPAITLFPCKVKKADPVKINRELRKKYGEKLQPKRNIKHRMWADTELVCKWDRRIITREGEIQSIFIVEGEIQMLE